MDKIQKEQAQQRGMEMWNTCIGLLNENREAFSEDELKEAHSFGLLLGLFDLACWYGRDALIELVKSALLLTDEDIAKEA